ncbi:MAG: hypothetical protein ACI4DP_11000 [Candidatus Ornithomonoglobus sp.]
MLTIDAMRTYTILDRILTAAGIDVSKLRYKGRVIFYISTESPVDYKQGFLNNKL